ncbi:hypothetical protein AB1E18_010626 [Capra hircus]
MTLDYVKVHKEKNRKAERERKEKAYSNHIRLDHFPAEEGARGYRPGGAGLGSGGHPSRRLLFPSLGAWPPRRSRSHPAARSFPEGAGSGLPEDPLVLRAFAGSPGPGTPTAALRTEHKEPRAVPHPPSPLSADLRAGCTRGPLLSPRPPAPSRGRSNPPRVLRNPVSRDPRPSLSINPPGPGDSPPPSRSRRASRPRPLLRGPPPPSPLPSSRGGSGGSWKRRMRSSSRSESAGGGEEAGGGSAREGRRGMCRSEERRGGRCCSCCWRRRRLGRQPRGRDGEGRGWRAGARAGRRKQLGSAQAARRRSCRLRARR